MQDEYKTKGFGYAGVDLYAGGTLTAQNMIKDGNLKSGDEAMVYGVFSQAERGLSEKGLADTLEKAGLKVDRWRLPRRRIPTLARRAGSDRLRPVASEIEGDRHPARRRHRHPGRRAEKSRQEARRYRQSAASTSRPATINGLKSGYVSATLDQLLYLQGFMPVLQCVISAKYKMPGLVLNTGAGVVTPKTIGALVPLIDAGIR